ncbi:hypothetical protein P154DRAFT_563070 [Amniculicola lignicola CBS 123094]|uniref:Uncharacterized protein n=1 Tax=Amniculicola lignicola CBS 123094 TaxID=1392246 RepID=A0A6A5WGA5_9PLEO|nr:hypothetical protein P154DRAFT_563070 [Amniculicola lignicola CBS 123094]
MASTSVLSPDQSAAAPTSLQVALAVAILRTKIKPGQRPSKNKTDSHCHYIDNAAYWQDRCKKLEARCQELEIVNDELSRAKDALQIAQPVKRKRGTSLRSQGVKRKKLEEESVATVMDSQGTIPDDLAVFDALGEAGRSLSHHLYTTHSLYAQDLTAPDTLCSSLVQISRAIGIILSSTAKYHDVRFHSKNGAAPALENDKSEMASVVRASGRSFTAIIVCLKKVTANASIGERHSSAHVIYEIVRLFQTVLATISESALRASRVAEARSVPAEKTNSKPKARNSPKDATASRYLAQFLNSIISFLDKDDSVHRELFEGISYVVLQHVAKRFNLCAARSVGEDGYVTDAGNFAILNGHDPPALRAKKELEAQAIGFEIRPLLSILEKVMAFAPAHLNSRPISSSSASTKRRMTSTNWHPTSTNKSPQAPAAPRCTLNAQVKEKMRRTLMNFIFPVSGNDEFADVLRKPARLVPLPVFKKEGAKAKGVEEQFMEGVWELFGLEVLESEDWGMVD